MAEIITGFDIFNNQEIFVQSFRINEPKTSEILKIKKRHYYNVICSIKGTFKVFCCDRSYDLAPGDIFISMPFEDFYVVYVDNSNEFDAYDKPIVSRIAFISNIFDDIATDENYLRSFNNRTKGKDCYYKKDDFDNCIQPIDLFNLSTIYVEKNLGPVHFKSLIGNLVTILSIAFDKKYGNLSSIASEDYDVKIWDYILNNCLSKITSQTIEKKFNVSKRGINKITNKFYGMAFHQTINNLRMWKAKSIMKKHIPLSKVATLCGFTNYSTFYRAYTSFFGVSPKEDFLYFKEHSIYLSDYINKKTTSERN